MSCSKGEIRKKAYTTKRGVHVSSTCVPDKGAVGHGPKTLPPIDKAVSLSKEGYSLSKPATARHMALKKASRKMGMLPVLKRVNLIRNYTADDANKSKLTADVKYLSREYKRSKKSSKKKSKKSSRK